MERTKTQEINSKKTSIAICFIVSFIYGALLLMIGYTQGGLKKVLFPDGTASDNMTYLLLGQSIGLVISAFLASRLIKIMNIRYIFLSGYGMAGVMLILISLIDKIAVPVNTDVYNVKGIVLFVIFSLVFGTSIGAVSPLTSTYFSAVFSGKKMDTYISVSNGIYGIGAGIIPLVASRPIYELGSNDFSTIRYFYYIALTLAFLGAASGYFLNYRHSKQQTSSKILNTSTMLLQKPSVNKQHKEKSKKNFSIWAPLIFGLVIMAFYMISETISNYMFVNFATKKDSSTDVSVNATMAFGLFVMVQGLWRSASGLWIMARVKRHWFILVSGLVIALAFVLMVAGQLENTGMMFFIAILLGFGLGNVWPTLYSYNVAIDEKRASFIGMMVNIDSMFWIPATQVLIAPIWSAVSDSDGFAFYVPALLGLIAAVGLCILTFMSIKFFKAFRNKHQLAEVE